VVGIAVVIGLLIWAKKKDDDPAVAPPQSSKPATVEDLLVGRWQTRLTSGADEVLSFEPLGANGEGTMSRQVYANGQLVDGWTGKYKFHDNPLLGPEDRRQLRMVHVDPNWGRKEEFVVLRSVSETTLVIAGIYDRKVVQYQRVR
jgi:hypothetical protein